MDARPTAPARSRLAAAAVVAAGTLASACIGNNHSAAGVADPTAVANTTPLIVDAGPAGSTGAINQAYVSVTVCVPGSTTQCATIDHVLLDTGSWGLRLVRSVLVGHALDLAPSTDASGRTLEECMSFVGAQTWGPVALADVHIAGESAAKVPLQIMDDTSSGAPPPAGCGANGLLENGVAGFNANGVLGAGVLVQDCGQACVAAAVPLAMYYGCSSAGACTAENVPLADQVANPVALFATDNNGLVVDLPDLKNANGDLSVQGTLTFGLATQSDNALPVSGLTVLEADAAGDFTTVYNGAATALPGLIDSGTSSYSFDSKIAPCQQGEFVGYYCPAVAPLSVSAVNTGSGPNPVSSTIDFAIANPSTTFVAGATAFIDLGGGGGSMRFTWGMPFFYGRPIYFGIEQRAAGSFTGPFYAY